MNIPFTKSNGGNQSSAPLIAALVLVALVPTVGVLWFMSVAMRNERLAVQERLTAVYANHLGSLQQRATAFVRERQAALAAHAEGAPAETFAAIVRAHLADGVIVTDAAGKVLYPSSSVAGADVRVEVNADWSRAQELEFQKNDLAGAAEIYGRIAESGGEANARARAMQAQAVCWLKAGETERALARLAELAGDASLRHAVSAQGALIAPQAQLLILKTLDPGRSLLAGDARATTAPSGSNRLQAGSYPKASEARASAFAEATADKEAPHYSQTLSALVAQLNDYADAVLPSGQRRFLMAEVQSLVSGRSLLAGDVAPESPASRLLQNTTFPTLAAENLAADYLDHDPLSPPEAQVERVAPNALFGAHSREARWGNALHLL